MAVPERRRRLARATAVFAAATGLSRILGFVREIVTAYFFGVRGAINAFEVAFLVPNTVRSLVADQALSAAFVPVFSELLAKGERARAWRVASTVFWLMLLGLGGLTAIFTLVAPWLMPALFPAYDEELLVSLSRLLFPTVVLLGVSGVIVGILNSYEHFAVPALAPVAWNLAIILGVAIGVPHADATDTKLQIYALSILAGTVLQVLLPVPWLRGRDGRLRVLLDVRDPAVRQIFVLMVPVTLALGLINFNALVDGIFASRLVDPDLAPAAINKAFRLYMLPQGIFSVAVATVLFPALSRLAALGDTQGFLRTANAGLRQIAFLLVPASVAAAVLAEPIVRLVYERGEFTSDQTPVVAGALAAFALGLTFNGAMLMLNRAFFSLQAPWTPTVLALANLTLNTVLNFALYRVGTWGLPLATSIANIFGAAALLIVLRRRIGRIDFGEIWRSATRVVLACVPLAVVSFAVWWVLDDVLGRSFWAQLVSLGSALLAGIAVYLVSSRLLRVRELEALLTLRSGLRRA